MITADLTPHRKPGESYSRYRNRRAKGREQVRAHLAGRFVWVSCVLRLVKINGKQTWVKEPAWGTYRRKKDEQ